MTEHFNANIRVVPHNEQRYDTVGDWVHTDAAFTIKASAMPDWRYEALVAVHELIEAILCKHRKITDESVTGFDKAFTGEDEPGDDSAAPYHAEHQFATRVETMLADELDVDWEEYEAATEALTYDRR